MLTDKTNVLELASLMLAHGIKEIVLCPGSRNIPLVQTFSALKEMKCYAVTDERSAGFFALGRSLESGNPTAVCCTSGTALLNLHPALAEARYQRIPLLILSADRPEAWIDQMDGQTLVQPGVFSQSGVHSVNIPEFRTEEDHWYGNRQINEALAQLEKRHPVHINLPLSEPLFQFSTPSLPEARIIRTKKFPVQRQAIMEQLDKFLKYRKILLVVGQRTPGKTYFLPDSIVCLHEHIGNHPCPDGISNFDSILLSLTENENMLEQLRPDLLITLGGHIVSKRLKNFLRKKTPQVHWNIEEDDHFTDLFCCLTHHIQISPELFMECMEALPDRQENTDYARQWHQLSDQIICPERGYSEMGAIGKLLDRLPTDSILHLGNSSVIRYAQLFPIGDRIEVHCNRGTSGIEGSLSTAVGYAADSHHPNFVIIGDLSFFYDANALWNRHLSKKLHILLINNEGGEIFKNLPGLNSEKESSDYILGKHQTSARAWAEERGFHYLHACNEAELDQSIKEFIRTGAEEKPILLEVHTDSNLDSTKLKEYHNKLKNIII